jgi:hypothetical protein
MNRRPSKDRKLGGGAIHRYKEERRGVPNTIAPESSVTYKKAELC